MINIEDKVMRVSGKHYIEVDTVNGILDLEDLRNKKKETLLKLMSYLIEDILPHKQDYPNSTTNTSVVRVSSDFVVLQREDYDKLINKLDNE